MILNPRLLYELTRRHILQALLQVLKYAELCVQAKLDGGRLHTGTLPPGEMIWIP
jgi:hypothetical protein